MRLLIVKLADIGDLITATPAIAAAAETPGFTVSVLTSPHAAPLLAGLSPHRAGSVGAPEAAVEVLEFPKAEFDALTAAARPDRLLRGARMALELRRRRFDAVALLHHLTTPAGVLKYRALAAATGAAVVVGLDNGRGGFLTDRVPDAGFGAVSETEHALRVVETLGVPRPVRPRPQVWPDAAEARRGRSLAGELGGAGFVALHPGTGPAAPARLYPARRWAEVAEGLLAAGRRVALVGGDGDREAAEAVQRVLVRDDAGDLADDRLGDGLGLPGRVGGMSIGAAAGLLAEASLFVGADSGLLHLAAAQGVPAVGLFGPTDPAAWAPIGEHVSVVRSAVACSPCLYQPGRPPLQIACAAPFCMDAIPVEAVVEAALAATGMTPAAVGSPGR